MSSGPQRPFISVKFTPAGRTQTFLLPDLALDGPDHPSPSHAGPPSVGPGDAVIVQTAEGPAVATVTRGIPQLDDRRRPASDASTIVVRKATRGDIVARLKHQQREQERQQALAGSSAFAHAFQAARGAAEGEDRALGLTRARVGEATCDFA